MKKSLWKITLAVTLLTGVVYSTIVVETTHAEEESIPSYAKWGRVAMKETMEKYPNAQILDYLHVGRTTKGEYVVEQFKLWVKENDKEFGLLIDIEFDPDTERIISIDFRKSEE